jgi:hypothetical protein
MHRFLSMTMAIILLSAFSVAAHIKGITQNENEVITGTAKGYLWGSGQFKITSSSGFICEGEYKFTEGRSKPAVGGLKCDDGLQGDIVISALNATASTGYGIAQLNNKRYAQFVYGEVPDYKNMSWSTAKERYINMSQQMREHIYYCAEYPETLKCKKSGHI